MRTCYGLRISEWNILLQVDIKDVKNNYLANSCRSPDFPIQTKILSGSIITWLFFVRLTTILMLLWTLKKLNNDG